MPENQNLKGVDFSIIRYANSWEDADILLEGLQLSGGENILSIGSGGDNALALLTKLPKSLDIVDVSAVQLYLIELKMAAFLKLEYNDMLQFMGVYSCAANVRKRYFEILAPDLSFSAKKYWKENLQLIEKGLIHAGKFENYFRKFRKYFLPFVHTKKEIEQLLLPKMGSEQVRFYNEVWNNMRWQLLLRLFFSKYVMGKQGRDPQFLKHVSIPVAQYIKQKTRLALSSDLCFDNSFIHYIFRGDFGPLLPFYLRPENFEKIKMNISVVSLHQDEMSTMIRKRNYDAYYCSNIFEYISANDFGVEAKSWAEHILPGSKMAFWNLMNKRSFAETNPENFTQLSELSSELSEKDKGFFYSRFLIEHRI